MLCFANNTNYLASNRMGFHNHSAIVERRWRGSSIFILYNASDSPSLLSLLVQASSRRAAKKLHAVTEQMLRVIQPGAVAGRAFV